jgi:hypothetical protein
VTLVTAVPVTSGEKWRGWLFTCCAAAQTVRIKKQRPAYDGRVKDLGVPNAISLIADTGTLHQALSVRPTVGRQSAIPPAAYSLKNRTVC